MNFVYPSCKQLIIFIIIIIYIFLNKDLMPLFGAASSLSCFRAQALWLEQKLQITSLTGVT